ncbi:MAG TPA: sialidase family protein, partial [Candidatus Binataceae bacterium]|nr:sialidase family protein [Candidatus Binataceae bacterium]
MPIKKIVTTGLIATIVSAVLALSSIVSAQSADERLAPLDAAAEHVGTLAANPHFRRDALFGAARNLVSVADRWAGLRPELVQMIDATASAGGISAAVVSPSVAGKPISKVTLGASRYSGFTQSETATAWCGSSVVVGFNDTGSEIRTLNGSGALSALGYSASSNRGGAFNYAGTPIVPGNANQSILGEPSLACADSDNFYYASIWSDNAQIRSGVAVAKSVNGGSTFAAPVVAISKNGLGHILDHDWIAVDHGNPTNLYVVYLDLDFSGVLCGTDAFAQPIPRYGVELIASSDAGSSWSLQPAVVEEVCANTANHNVSLAAPQVAVAPGGEVYVTWEAMGENGGTLTAREIRVAKSIDHGASFAAPVIVAPVVITGNGADLQGSVRSSEFPSIAIGVGKTNGGFIYLTWTTAAFSTPDTISTIGSYGFADVVFSQSQNGGANWSTPARVNNNTEGGSVPLSDQFKPAIASDKNGHIGICFYDRRRDPNNFLIDRYCALSTNGGGSWKNTKITPLNFSS